MLPQAQPTPSQLSSHQAHLERRARLWSSPGPKQVVIPPAPPPREPMFPPGTPFDFFRPANWMNIVLFMALRHNTTVAALLGHSRLREHVETRHIAILMIHRHCPHLSTPDIGRRFGRDHTTIIHSLRKGQQLLDQRGRT